MEEGYKLMSKRSGFAVLLTLALVGTACGTPSTPGGAPTAAAPTAAATAAPTAAAKEELIVVQSTEPEFGFLPRDMCSGATHIAQFQLYEHLTTRDQQGNVVGQLAESWKRLDATTWRFTLRTGIAFSNGETFNADAVLAAVEHEFGPDAKGRCKSEYSALKYPAVKVDDRTVDISTTAAEPLFPSMLRRFKIPAPKWLKETPAETQATTAVGSGPYKLVEWKKGSHILMEANPTYHGTPKPATKRLRVLFRGEAAVRAAMVQAGEADIAMQIPQEAAKTAPQTIRQLTSEVVAFRINTEHPVLKDVRVREAIALSIDTKALMSSLYEGVSEAVNGQMARPSVLGFDASLPQYSYDPARAKQLVTEAGAAGQTVELVIRAGVFPKVQELGEALVGYMAKTGLDARLRSLEAAQWQVLLAAVGPGQPRSDMLLTSASNPHFDSIRPFTQYFGCKARFSHWCSESISQRIDDAVSLEGDARKQAWQKLWGDVYKEYYVISLFGLDEWHAAAKNISWVPRQDGWPQMAEVQFK